MGIYAITGASSGIGAKTKELLIQLILILKTVTSA